MRHLGWGELCALIIASLLGGCASTSSWRWPAWPEPSRRPLRGSYEQELPPHAPLIIADFDLPKHVTNVGTPFGAWNSDPGDATQFCRVRLVDTQRVGNAGYSLMLEYDVESPNPAYNGVWMKLPPVSLAVFEALSFSIKGDAAHGFTKRLRLELKGHSHVARFQLDGITAEWQHVRIPLRSFEGIRQVKEATEFVIVFDEETVTEPVGVLYLDNVAFEPAA